MSAARIIRTGPEVLRPRVQPLHPNIQRNFEAIRPHLSKWAPPWAPNTTVHARFIGDESGPLDILYREGRFYGQDARELAQKQADEFFTAEIEGAHYYPPVTIIMKDDDEAWAFCHRLDERSGGDAMMNPKFPPPKRHYWPTYCPRVFVWGIGMGLHIPLILERMEGNHLYLVETDPHCMMAALTLMNWTALLARAKELGIKIEIVFCEDPVACAEATVNTARFAGLASWVGARFFQHHRLPSIMAMCARFAEVGQMAVVPGGYFTDEFRQCLYARDNLKAGSTILTKRAPDLPDTALAAVIGSGPSLDKSWDLIRALKDRATLICCGTALGPMLKAGIMPDMLVNLETGPGIVEFHRELCDEAFRANVPFLTSASSPPELVGMFAKTYLFPRSDGASTFLTEGLADAVKHSFARVGNAGAAIAVHLGFRAVALLGMDCGYPDDQDAHAEGYRVNDGNVHTVHIKNEDIKADLGNPRRSAIFPSPAIGGGKVMMDPLFMLSVSSFGSLMAENKGIEFYQIGHGAVLKAAANLPPEDFDPDCWTKYGAADGLLARCAPKADLWGGYRMAMMIAANRAEIVHGLARKAYECPLNCELDFVRADEALWDVVDAEPPYRPAGVFGGMIRGTVTTTARCVMERAWLIADRQERMVYLETAREEMLTMLDAMAGKVEAEFLPKGPDKQRKQ